MKFAAPLQKADDESVKLRRKKKRISNAAVSEASTSGTVHSQCLPYTHFFPSHIDATLPWGDASFLADIRIRSSRGSPTHTDALEHTLRKWLHIAQKQLIGGSALVPAQCYTKKKGNSDEEIGTLRLAVPGRCQVRLSASTSAVLVFIDYGRPVRAFGALFAASFQARFQL